MKHDVPDENGSPHSARDRACLVAGRRWRTRRESGRIFKPLPNDRGAAAAARVIGSVEAAKRYYRALTVLVVGGDGDRPEISEARIYLAQN